MYYLLLSTSEALNPLVRRSEHTGKVSTEPTAGVCSPEIYILKLFLFMVSSFVMI